MMLFRRAQYPDLADICMLASKSGITTLPNDAQLLEKRLQWSHSSFNKTALTPHNEYYLFVLEDTHTNTVVGTAAIEAFTGQKTPFYSYKLSTHQSRCPSLRIQNDYEMLTLVNDNQGRSELCTLFLDKAYRHHHNGLFLSRARFLFIAHYPERFNPILIAEMRGIITDTGHSPFWDNVGSRFFHIPFEQADYLSISTDKQFIADLMPKQAIYVSLLSPAAQEVIGKPHPSTMPAMAMLLHEGFKYHHYVDIFDAGPTIEAQRDTIRTIALSQLFVLKRINNRVHASLHPSTMIANTAMDFRATLSDIVDLNPIEKTCTLPAETAHLLDVQCGDMIRLVPFIYGRHEK